MKYCLISCFFGPYLLYATFELFSTNQEKSLLLSPNLVWSIRNTMSILHVPVWVQFISCLYCYKCWAHSKVDEMRGGPDTIYSAGRDMSPWLPNGFLHFTQLFPLRKSYRYRLLPCWPKYTQHSYCALIKYLWIGRLLLFILKIFLKMFQEVAVRC